MSKVYSICMCMYLDMHEGIHVIKTDSLNTTHCTV